MLDFFRSLEVDHIKGRVPLSESNKTHIEYSKKSHAILLVFDPFLSSFSRSPNRKIGGQAVSSVNKMLSQVVKVQRKKLAACMTCPLCNKLFRDATTVSECLHTFCRKCIYDKISDEDVDCCPVCNIDLGCAPLEKLRADHSLEDLKVKLLGSKSEKTQAPAVLSSVAEAIPSFPLEGKRKERSLSSLVISTPKIGKKSLLPRKRLKSIARKSPALRESILAEELLVKKVDDCCHESLSSPETLSKILQAKRQNSIPESSKQYKTNKDTEDSAEPCEGKTESWKTLNFVVEGASKSKHNKPDIEEATVQMQLPGPAENEDQVLKSVVKEHGKKSKVNGDENNSSLSPVGSVKTRKLQGVRQKRAIGTEGLNIIPPQTIVDASSKYDGRFSPIWFSLVASDDQEGDAPLPQISSCYLRVKDGSLPVSSIKKYLVQKLGLASEAEVEISLHGQPVLSTLQLHHLVEWWLHMAPSSERIETTVGSSAKEFVMVLSYGRKTQPP